MIRQQLSKPPTLQGFFRMLCQTKSKIERADNNSNTQYIASVADDPGTCNFVILSTIVEYLTTLSRNHNHCHVVTEEANTVKRGHKKVLLINFSVIAFDLPLQLISMTYHDAILLIILIFFYSWRPKFELLTEEQREKMVLISFVSEPVVSDT